MFILCNVTDACLFLLCLVQFFSTKPRDWLGRTSLNDLFCVEWDVKPEPGDHACVFVFLLDW